MSAPVVLGITIRADGSAQVAGEINRVQAAVTGAGTAAQNTNREFANMARSTQALSGIMGAFGVTLGLVGLVAFAKELTKTVEQVQNLSIRLKGLTKDADDYAKVQGYLVDVSNRHHKSNLVLADSFSRLLTLEQTGLITRQQSMALLEGMSNASSKTGASTEQLKQSMFGLSQALGSGVLHMEELNQVTEPMPGLLNRIAEASGFTVGEFRKLVGEGRVTSEVFGKVMVGAFTSYQGAAEAAGETLTAKYADIGNSWTALAKAVEAPVVNTLSPILDLITSQIHGLAQDLRELKDFYTAIKTSAGYGVGGAPDNGQTVDLTGRAKPPAQADPAKDSAAAIRAEIEATAASTKTKKEHKAAISDEERASIALTKSFNDAIESLNLHNIELSKTPRELEEATLKSKGYTDAMVKQALALYDIGTALEAKKKLNETEKTELQALTDQYNKLTMSAHDYYVTTLNAKLIPTADQAPLVAQFDKNTGLEASKKAATEATTTLDAYNKSLDSANTKTSDLGKVTSAIFDGALGGIHLMAGAFDTMVNSISANTKGLEENAKMQKLNNQETDPAKKAANISLYAKEEAKLNNDNIKAQLTGASQLAGAAASMFDKKSAAAKAFHAIEVTLSVARLAMDAVEIASSIGKTIVKVTEGAASMFATMGPLGFAGVAAMLAVMAGLGFAASGGGSDNHVPVSTASPDTGSVLGDASASSDSVNKTYTLLKDIQAQNYPVLKSIDAGISGLASGISNVITRLYQGGGLANISAPAKQDTFFGSMASVGLVASVGLMMPLISIIGWLGNGLFGGAKSYKVTGQGLGTDATNLSDVRDSGNVNAYQYANIETKTDGGWFGSNKYSNAQQRSGIDSATQKAFNSIFKSMGDTMFGLADALGGDLTKRVNDSVIPAMNVELKGLSGDDSAKKMNGVISTMLDNMAGAVFGDVLGQYQKLGEGMLETAVRIATQIVIVKDALSSSSIKLVDNVIAVSDALVAGAGSLKDFQSQFASYFDKFYSDTEKQTKSQTQLNSQLISVGVSLAASREGYRKQVEAIDITTAAGQAQYTMMLKLSGAADTYYATIESKSALIKSKSALDQQYLSLTGKALEALTIKRKEEIAALDKSLQLTQQSIYIMTDANNAVAKAVNDVSKSISTMQALATKLRAALPASATASLDDRAGAMAVLNSALAISKAGGSIDNIAGMSQALATIAKPSEQLYSSFTDYARAQAQTSDTITQLADYADLQVSDAQKQIDAINGTTNSVLAVKDAITNLATALNVQAVVAKTISTAQGAAKAATSAGSLSDAANAKALASANALPAAQKNSDQLQKDVYNANLNVDYIAAREKLNQLIADYQNTSRATNVRSQASIEKANITNAYIASIASKFSAKYDPNPRAAPDKIWTLTPKYDGNTKGLAAAGSQTSAAAIAAATGLTALASAAAALIPNLTAVSAADASAASDALAKSRTANTYAVATQSALPAFASGGAHDGGWRIVGENGPELENTGPSRIFSNSQSKSMLNNDDLIAEIRQLREEARANAAALARNTAETSRIINRWDGDGMPAARVTV